MSFGNGNVKTAIDLTSGGASPRRAAPVSSPSFASGQQSAIRVTFTRRRERGGERGEERGGRGGHPTVLEGKAAKLEKEDGDDDGRKVGRWVSRAPGSLSSHP